MQNKIKKTNKPVMLKNIHSLKGAFSALSALVLVAGFLLFVPDRAFAFSELSFDSEDKISYVGNFSICNYDTDETFSNGNNSGVTSFLSPNNIASSPIDLGIEPYENIFIQFGFGNCIRLTDSLDYSAPFYYTENNIDSYVIGVSPNEFNLKGKLSDDSIVETPYIFNTSDLNDLSLVLRGDNPLNVYDSYKIDILSGGYNLGVPLTGNIGFSCTNNCLIVTVPLSDFNYTWEQYKTYTFRLSLLSSFAAPTKTLSFSVGFNTPPVEQEVCGGITDIGCNIQLGLTNAFKYLFSPSEETLSDFSSLTLENKAPFSYLYDLDTVWNELFSNSGSSEMSVSVTTPLGPISFISRSQIEAVPYTGLIKTIITSLLYLFTALTIYKLVLRVHD